MGSCGDRVRVNSRTIFLAGFAALWIAVVAGGLGLFMAYERRPSAAAIK